jgi:hypothetical protein
MSSLLFVVVALLVAAGVITFLWYRERRESSLEDGIEEFHRELQALSPETRLTVTRPPTQRKGPGGRPG